MIRIGTRKEASRTVVTIDGRMAASDLEEVQHVRQTVLGAVVLDLGGLDACGDEGIALLRDWLNRGAQLLGAAPFLRMVLENAKGQPQRRVTRRFHATRRSWTSAPQPGHTGPNPMATERNAVGLDFGGIPSQ